MYKTLHGLVLREVKYKESSKILTILTEEEGKITAEAKGVLRKGSKCAAAAQALVWSELTVSEYRGRYTLTEGSVLTEPARRQRRFAVVFGSKRLNFYRNGGIPPAEYDKITQVWTLEAKNLFSFPLRWICETITARGAERVELSEEEVKQALAASLSDRLHERLGTDGQVLSEHWSSAADGGWLRLTLRSECLERIDEESPGERPQRYQ